MWPSGGQRWPSYGIGIIPRHVRRLVAPTAQDLRDAAVAQYQRERAEAERAASEENRAKEAARSNDLLPQAGAEQAVTPAHSRPPSAQRLMVHSTPPRDLVPGAPRDQDELRLSLMRKMLQILKPWRGCPARVCRRHRDCASPYFECQSLPARQVSPERGEAALAHFQRALARRTQNNRARSGATPAPR